MTICVGVRLIQHLDQNGIVVEVSELAVSNKKSPIHVLHVDDDPSLQEITKLMLLDLNSSFEIDNPSCVDEAFKKQATGGEREETPFRPTINLQVNSWEKHS